MSSHKVISHIRRRSEFGVAMILVIFLIALLSIIVVNVAYSTQLSARLNAGALQGLQAEYILKSALNVARVLIKEDTSPDEDAKKDPWGPFINGMPIPPNMLGLTSANLKVDLEIRPEEAKVPIRALVVSGQGKADPLWRDVLVRLFRSLGFDNDKEEEDQTGIFPRQHFDSAQLVANLIDYMDGDKQSYSEDNFPSGIESEGNMPEGLFPNERIRRLSELATIPGFTPTRIRKLTPFVTTFGSNRINLNLAPPVVLKALNERIGDTEVGSIISYRDSEEGPFSQANLSSQMTPILGADVYQEISTMVGAQSRWFQVISRVDSGNTIYFLRAYVSKGQADELPNVRSLELF